MYYNYHNRATKLIKEGHLTGYVFRDSYNNISPCLLLRFDNHRPMPIRAHRFAAYENLIKQYYPDLNADEWPEQK